MSSEIVSLVACERIKRQFEQSEHKQFVMVKGFLRDEFAKIANRLASDETFPVRTVLIAKDRIPGVPGELFLSDTLSATHHRNADGSVVFLQVDEFSDLSGLSKVYQVNDGNLLGQNEIDETTATDVLRAAWRVKVGSPKSKVPGAIESVILDLIRAFRETGTSLALRPWVTFNIELVDRLSELAAIDSKAARSAMGHALPRLEMFPDLELQDLSQELVRHRRLQSNLYCSRDKTPTGRDFDREVLLSVLDTVGFQGLKGEELDSEEQDRIRGRLRSYLEPHGSSTTAEVDFGFWLQLFEHKARKRGLGEKIRAALAEIDQELIGPLETTQILQRLDDRDSEAAQDFLDCVDSDGRPLGSLCPENLRRQVEKLANPKAPSSSYPLRSLVRIIREIRAESDHGSIVIRPRKLHGVQSEALFSRALFSFLYGDVLQRLIQESEGALKVDSTLLNFGALQKWHSGLKEPVDDTIETETEDVWAPLELEISAEEDSNSTLLRWSPAEDAGWVVLARVASEPDDWHWRRSGNFEQFKAEAIEKPKVLGACEAPKTMLGKTVFSLRREFLADTWRYGLLRTRAESYINSWQSILSAAKTEYAPSGTADPQVEEMLLCDVVQLSDDQKVLLSSHPLRLRWIVDDLRRSEEFLREVIQGTLTLNQANENFFFDQIELASAHEQPALLCDSNRAMVAVREESGHEHFQTIKTRERTVTDWLSGTDDASLDEMANQVGGYLAAFPHAEDGLRLLLIGREDSARVTRRILDRIRKQVGPLGRRTEMKLVVDVVAPPVTFGDVAGVIEDLDQTERQDRSFPSIELRLHPWESLQEFPVLDGISGEIDVAIVPNLFAARARCQEASRRAVDFKGGFRPAIDSATARHDHSDGGSDSSVSLRLVPDAYDRLLTEWSTVNVRQFRGTPVAPDPDSEQVDLLTLTVGVLEASQFFSVLHSKAQWVITLDAFVGRRQLESFEHGPDVIDLREGLGKSGAYTLIVSSQIGRDFVIARMAERLTHDLANSRLHDTRHIASKVYDAARVLNPRALLRSTGLGRTAQELVGVVASREITEQFLPPPKYQDGFTSWISLDEHNAWFGGLQNRRADLMRIDGWMEGERLILQLTIVEAKLRDKGAITTALAQLDETIELVAGAFVSKDEIGFSDDADYWWAALARAVQDSARKANAGPYRTFRGSRRGAALDAMPAEWLVWVKEGRVDVRGVQGVVCTYAGNGEPGQAKAKGRVGDHHWIQFNESELARVLQTLGGGREHNPLLHGNQHSENDEMPSSWLRTDAANLEDKSKEYDSSELPADESAKGIVRNKGLGPDELRERYQLLLNCFAEFGVDVEAVDESPVVEGPSLLVFRVRPGYKVSTAKVENQVNHLKLRMALPAELTPRAYIDSGTVVFEIPKAAADRYPVRTSELWSGITNWPKDRLWVPIGEDIHGNAVSLDFSSSDSPHLLIGGMTGSGKSVAMETILGGLTSHYSAEELRIFAVDPKGLDLQFLEGIPHLEGEIGFDGDDAEAVLSRLVDEMQERYRKMKDRRARKISEYNALSDVERMPWNLLVLEEYADLTTSKKQEIEAHLQRLAQKARACGIHVIVSTQKPSADVLNTTVRSNLGAQLAFRVKDAVNSRIILGESGAETLGGKGDGLYKSVGGGIVRFQCAIQS